MVTRPITPFVHSWKILLKIHYFNLRQKARAPFKCTLHYDTLTQNRESSQRRLDHALGTLIYTNNSFYRLTTRASRQNIHHFL